MKKQVALLTTALLATSFVLGATSCASKDVSKAIKGVSYSESTTAVSALKEGDIFTEVDNAGLMVVTKANYETVDNNPVLKSTTYKLFDVTTNALVSGAEVTKVDKPATLDETNLFTVTSGLEEKVSGLYYSTKTQFTRVSLEATIWNYETTISLYGKNGKVADNIELNKGTISTSNMDSLLGVQLPSLVNSKFVNNIFTYKDGTRYYLDVNYNLAKEEDPLARIVTTNSDVEEYGDYLVEECDGFSYAIYTKDGEYVRTLNGVYELEIPASVADEPVEWSVGNYMFVQYQVMLPENAKKYDIISYGDDGAMKYDLVTKRYDLEKGKVKEIDMDYVVNYSYYEGVFEESSILSVSEIKDEQVMMASVLQAFDEKGKVAVDLQALVPGADGIAAAWSDYMVLTVADMEYVVQGKEVVGEFVEDSVSYAEKFAYVYENMDNGPVSNATWIKFYNLDGTLNKSYTDAKISTVGNDFVIKLETSVVKVNKLTGAEKTVCTFGEKDQVQVAGYYVSVMQANDAANAEDDTVSLYWLIDGMTDLKNLTMEQAEAYDFDQVSYYVYGNTEIVRGAIITIEQTTGEGENETTTATFYNYAIKQAY